MESFSVGDEAIYSGTGVFDGELVGRQGIVERVYTDECGDKRLMLFFGFNGLGVGRRVDAPCTSFKPIKPTQTWEL